MVVNFVVDVEVNGRIYVWVDIFLLKLVTTHVRRKINFTCRFTSSFTLRFELRLLVKLALSPAET